LRSRESKAVLRRVPRGGRNVKEIGETVDDLGRREHGRNTSFDGVVKIKRRFTTMWKRLMTAFLAAGFAAGAAFAASPKMGGGHGDDPVLPGGGYSAKAKSLACGGCAETIEKAMRGIPGIERASVDKKTGTVDFAVRGGASVRWSDLQKTLKAASDRMGMGADYTLTDFKFASAETAAPTKKESPASCCPHGK